MGDTTTDTRLLVPIPDSMHALGGLGRTTIYELCEAGELTRVRIGTRAFITAESIRALIARNTETPGTSETLGRSRGNTETPAAGA